MRVVVLAPSGSVASTLEALRDAGEPNDDIGVVSAAPLDDVDAAGVLVSTGLPVTNRLTRALSRSAIGRNLLRLTPWDGGRRFAGAVRRNSTVSSIVTSADLIVAIERDAILAAWQASRRRPHGPSAVYGVAAARARVTRG